MEKWSESVLTPMLLLKHRLEQQVLRQTRRVWMICVISWISMVLIWTTMTTTMTRRISWTCTTMKKKKKKTKLKLLLWV
jgi:hypothetical protein